MSTVLDRQTYYFWPFTCSLWGRHQFNRICQFDLWFKHNCYAADLTFVDNFAAFLGPGDVFGRYSLKLLSLNMCLTALHFPFMYFTQCFTICLHLCIFCVYTFITSYYAHTFMTFLFILQLIHFAITVFPCLPQIGAELPVMGILPSPSAVSETLEEIKDFWSSNAATELSHYRWPKPRWVVQQLGC